MPSLEDLFGYCNAPCFAQLAFSYEKGWYCPKCEKKQKEQKEKEDDNKSDEFLIY